MKLREILGGIEYESFADLDAEIGGISYDSRTTKPGDLFVAIKGFESDGHKYIPMALEKGAVCVLCEEKPDSDSPYVISTNTRRALSVASANFFGRPADKMKIVGITGTNGKTTTTNLIKTIIEKSTGSKVGLIGTIGNMIGDKLTEAERTTPESYELQKMFREMLDAGCEYVVMEVSSHALSLDRVYGVTFEVGVFTNLTQDHLDFHKTMDAYAEAKALLFKQCRFGAVNMDDEYAKVMIDAAECPILTFSAEKTEADLCAVDIKLKSDGVKFCALTIGQLKKIKMGIPGMFSVYNALSAAAAAMKLGISLGDIAEALSNTEGVKGRAEVVPTGRDFTILIDYSHTPDAVENILNTVKGFAQGCTVILFGCGGDRDRTKSPIMGKIAVDMADFAIITSDNPRTEEPSQIINDILEGVKGTKTPYVVIENRKEAIGWAIENAQPGDVIVLAGKGHETYQIIGKTKNHFDEREIVAEFLAQ